MGAIQHVLHQHVDSNCTARGKIPPGQGRLRSDASGKVRKGAVQLLIVQFTHHKG